MQFAADRRGAHGSQGLLSSRAVLKADLAGSKPASAGTQRVESARAGTVEHTGGLKFGTTAELATPAACTSAMHHKSL